MKFEQVVLKRLTVHKIYGKSRVNTIAYAGKCQEISRLDNEAMYILHERIDACLRHRSKFYELDLQDASPGSFFALQQALYGTTSDRFLVIAQQLADKAAAAHINANIPDGLLLLVEATINTHPAIIVVKAEKSNAFSLTGNELQLVRDIFLSGDKTLYKVGFFIRTDTTHRDAKAYRYYVYDDAFTPSRGNLAHYFYSSFLGLSTEKNSRLLTNNFHKTLISFTQYHIDVGDKYELMRSIDRAFLDQGRKMIHAADFKSFFPEDLEPLYEEMIEKEFPHAFVKDNTIMKSIATKKIALTPEATLLVKNAPDGIITGNTKNETDVSRLKVSLDSGEKYHFVLVPAMEIKDTTRPNPQQKIIEVYDSLKGRQGTQQKQLEL
jgi:hypothetical protein